MGDKPGCENMRQARRWNFKMSSYIHTRIFFMWSFFSNIERYLKSNGNFSAIRLYASSRTSNALFQLLAIWKQSALYRRFGTWSKWKWHRMWPQLTRSMNFIGPQTKERMEEVFRNALMTSWYCAIAWRKGSILLRFWAVLLLLCFSWRPLTAFSRSARVVRANDASSSGLSRLLKSARTCLKLSSMVAILGNCCCWILQTGSKWMC